MSGESSEWNINSSSEDEEDCETLQRQALFVPDIGEDEDLSAPPMDGFEFLKRAVVERRRCDAIVVKEVKTKTQKNVAKQILDFPEEKSNPDFCMDKESQLHCLAEFSELRLRYEARRKKMTKVDSKKIRQFWPSKNMEERWLELFSKTPPNLAKTLGLHNSSVELCLAVSQPKICSVMEYMDGWIIEGELKIPVACQWIYTLLACLELPLDPDTHAALRRIARALILLRSKLESIACEELPHINVVICVIGRYFSQLDLADPMV